MDFLTEIYKAKMDIFTACRICLNTDVKLYNMSQYRLKSIYEELCESNLSQIDEMSDFVCSYCAASLNKFALFKEKCKQSKDLMEFLIAEPKHLTADNLIHINTIKASITLPYTFRKLFTFDSTLTTDIKEECFDNIETKSNVTEINHDFDNKEFLDDYAFMNDSDDEPLSKIIREGRESKKEKYDEDHLPEPRIKIESTFVNEDIGAVKDWDINIERSIAELKNGHVDDLLIEMESKNVGRFEKECENDEYYLVLLTEEQQIEEVLARKKSSNYMNSLYKCQHCFKGFMTDLTYKNHMVRHDKAAGAFPCGVCGARWADERTRRAHVSAAHERHYRCKRCPHTAKSHHKAKEHVQWHKGYLFTCQICGASFKKSTTYLTHIRLQHPTTTTCAVCGAACLGKFGLNMHMKKAHKKTEWNTEYLECNICKSKFRNKSALKRHLRSHVNGACDTKLSLLSCENCGEGFTEEELYKEHLETHRSTCMTCSICSRTFASERSLAVHHNRVHRTDEHRATATARCVCETCGYTCTSRMSLVYHQRRHTGEKPFQCTLCEKRFSVYQRLQIHIRTHTGERPFKCGVCPKAFKHKAALNRHDRVHTGARPYRCATCGKTFSQSNSMKQHAASVHLKAPLYARKNKPK